MDQQGASALATRITHEPGWRAEASYNRQTGAWTVKAWPTGSATPETFTSPFAWHYLQAKMKTSLRRMKAIRRGIR